MSCSDNNSSANIEYYFIGNSKELQKEYIFTNFDTNYIPLQNIPISYYETIKPKNNDKDLNNLITQLNVSTKIYNTYNIYPIAVSVVILIVILLIIFMRFIFFKLYYIYSYLLIFIVLGLIIIGSMWFLYINNETL
jgi:hypothetical protein